MPIKSTLSTLLALATLNYAAPQKSTPLTYRVGLQVFGYNGDPSAYAEWSADLNKLATHQGRGQSVATHVQFGGPVYNVDVNAVQCRAYGNVEGTIPVGDAFNVTHVLDLGGDPVGMYSILCYIVSEKEHT